jgi:glycosyltransferase involved in cell wall biosynthesis
LTPLVYPVVVRQWAAGPGAHSDLFVFHSYAGWLAIPAADARGIPTVVAFHGLEPMYHAQLREEAEQSGGLSWRYRMLQERLMPLWLRRSCRRASLVLCLNQAERQYLIDNGWATADRIATFFHGVPGDFLLPERAPRPATALLFVGQWLPMKGVAYLRDAFTELARRHPDLRLTCAGTLAGADVVLDSFPPDIRDRITVVPRLDRPALVDLYRRSDILVNASLYEGFGLALLEAMAARLPIVTTRVGIAADALKDGESALVIPMRHPDAIVRETERLLADAALRERLGDAAHDAALHYRESAAVAELADRLIAAIERSPARRVPTAR